ncbi:DUF1996 domain-containing protein, partial [bacterium]|nr:DUF1996 domain-containing protein [bacterium]
MNVTYRSTVIFSVCLLAGLLSSASLHAQATEVQLQISDGAAVDAPLKNGESLSVPQGSYTLEALSSLPVARMRLQGEGSNCAIKRLNDISNADDPSTLLDDFSSDRFSSGQFVVDVTNASTCTLVVNTWYENYRWAGASRINLTFTALPVAPEPEPEPEPEAHPHSDQYAVTVGTAESLPLDTSSPPVEQGLHGTRLYCNASHLNYDDPVVFPGAPGMAHLHLYWGNTGANAHSTRESLANSGLASCEGGRSNQSAYWAPAIFNAAGEVVLPESIFVYYKSFGNEATFDRSTIQAVPNGLQMLANQQVLHSGAYNFRVSADGNNGLDLRINFPMCLQVNQDWNPVLSSADNISHLAYGYPGDGNANECPSSHPYRIPQLTYIIRYADIPFTSEWQLSSDRSSATRGQSLHADYFASWDEETMNRIVQCNIESRRECQFVDERGTRPLYRDQLPERFNAPDGTRLYIDSTRLLSATDRTPFGTSLLPMSSQQEGNSH